VTGARTVRIGAGAGYSGDRIEPAIELAERGDLDYLCFECLAERTIALAQQARLLDPEAGFDPLLAERMERVLPACRARGTRIVTNMGAANPAGAARATVAIARRLGLAGLRVAAIEGDDVLALMQAGHYALQERDGTVATLGDAACSANAYLGAGPIAAALARGADIVITGRVGDPALFLGPLIHAFGWDEQDWPRLGAGVLAGHLLECAGQVTGGYFADPGAKDVPGLARLGFPLAEIAADGTGMLTKVAGSGGCITLATCKEQLLYEVLDPARYVQPDVVADFTGVRFEARGPDRIAFAGATGRARPETLKVSVGYRDGYVGEGQISYAGPGAVRRGRLAIEIVRERLGLIGLHPRELRCELIGVDAIHAEGRAPEPAELRARIVARTATMQDAIRVGNEVEALYTNGPAGGGGAWKSARAVIAVASALIPRALVTPRITMETA
jgi:hypothetical protein